LFSLGRATDMVANVTGLHVLYYLCNHISYRNTRWRGSLVSRHCGKCYGAARIILSL